MGKSILTKKRVKYVSRRKPKVIKGSRLNYNAALQGKYIAALERLVKKMTEETSRRIKKLFETQTAEQFYQVAQDASIASQARILTNELAKKFNSLFAGVAKPIAEKMVRGQAQASKSTLHTSLKKLSGGMSIKTSTISTELKTIIKASVSENVALIKSISIDYQSRVQKQVMRSITSGNGLESLIPALEKYEGITERQAKNMALDQTRKVYNTMNKSRMQGVGVKRFEWVHSGGGQKPRQSHIAISGNIYSFDDLPLKDEDPDYPKGLIPGQAINCGCTMIPVIEFDEEEN